MSEPEFSGAFWFSEGCPACGHTFYGDEPPAGCTIPRFRLLHWLCYLSEDRAFAAWHIDCQAVVLGWCSRPVPASDDEPGFATVTEAEARTVLELVEEAGGEWRWAYKTENHPRWYPRDAA